MLSCYSTNISYVFRQSALRSCLVQCDDVTCVGRCRTFIYSTLHIRDGAALCFMLILLQLLALRYLLLSRGRAK